MFTDPAGFLSDKTRVIHLDANGSILNDWDYEGDGSGHFALRDNQVYVLNKNKTHIYRYNLAGVLQTEFLAITTF